MRPIVIPLLIITLIVSVYYARDVWNEVKSSVPFLGEKELKLPGSQEKPAPSPGSNSPYDVLK